MSVESVLGEVGHDVKGFFTKFIADVAKARAVWNIISSQQTRAILLKVGGDVVKAFNDAEAAAMANGLNVTLDLTVVGDLKQLFDDAKAGDGVIITDLKTLGITL